MTAGLVSPFVVLHELTIANWKHRLFSRAHAGQRGHSVFRIGTSSQEHVASVGAAASRLGGCVELLRVARRPRQDDPFRSALGAACGAPWTPRTPRTRKPTSVLRRDISRNPTRESGNSLVCSVSPQVLHVR